jgi:hypothetical protein
LDSEIGSTPDAKRNWAQTYTLNNRQIFVNLSLEGNIHFISDDDDNDEDTPAIEFEQEQLYPILTALVRDDTSVCSEDLLNLCRGKLKEWSVEKRRELVEVVFYHRNGTKTFMPLTNEAAVELRSLWECDFVSSGKYLRFAQGEESSSPCFIPLDYVRLIEIPYGAWESMEQEDTDNSQEY